MCGSTGQALVALDLFPVLRIVLLSLIEIIVVRGWLMDTLQSDVKAGANFVGPLGALSDIFLGSKSPLNAMVKRPKPDSQ